MPTVPSEEGVKSPRQMASVGRPIQSAPGGLTRAVRSADRTQDRHRGRHAASDPAQAAERLATHGVSQPRVDRSAPMAGRGLSDAPLYSKEALDASTPGRLPSRDAGDRRVARM